MNNNRILHNIVASTILADAMRHIRNEFMVSIRGYLRSKPEDDELFTKAEHSARQALEVSLSERAQRIICPHCASENLDFVTHADYNLVKDQDGNKYLYHAAVCRHCGKNVYMTTKYMGVLSEGEFNNLQKNGTTSPFQEYVQR